MKQNGAHGDAAELDAFVRIRDLIPHVRGGNAIKNRSVVFERGMRFGQEIWPPFVGSGKFFLIALLDGLLDVLIEFVAQGYAACGSSQFILWRL